MIDLWLLVFRLSDAPIQIARHLAYRRLYLRSRHWRTTRATAIALARGRCQDCGGRSNLEAHHLTYARLGHEEHGDLVVLCRLCHAERHALRMAATAEVVNLR